MGEVSILKKDWRNLHFCFGSIQTLQEKLASWMEAEGGKLFFGLEVSDYWCVSWFNAWPSDVSHLYKLFG